MIKGEDRGVGTARDPALRHKPPVEVIFLNKPEPKSKFQIPKFNPVQP